MIELQGVERTYPGPAEVRALRPTDLSLGSGTYTAVVGPSGSGKSTLLNILGLLDVPDAGTYRLGGFATGDLSDGGRAALRASHIGFVFQQFHLLRHRSVADNVELGLLYGRRRRADWVGLIDVALARVGLGHRRDVPAATLSGGEAQRVAIARGIVHEPRLLLADEPTGNLDTRTSDAVLDVIGRLHAQLGLTIVMVTHDPLVAARAEHTVEVVDGKVRAA